MAGLKTATGVAPVAESATTTWLPVGCPQSRLTKRSLMSRMTSVSRNSKRAGLTVRTTGFMGRSWRARSGGSAYGVDCGPPVGSVSDGSARRETRTYGVGDRKDAPRGVWRSTRVQRADILGHSCRKSGILSHRSRCRAEHLLTLHRQWSSPSSLPTFCVESPRLPFRYRAVDRLRYHGRL
jgi:hypothetical protein